MKLMLLATSALAALYGVAYACDLHLNTSKSMPLGIWHETSAKTYDRGDVVLVCPPLTDRQKVYLNPDPYPGGCPSGMEPMVKPIAAVAGDVVTLSARGVTVNGNHIPFTAPMPKDGAGRPLQAYPAGTYTVAPGQVWLLVTLPYSFDSRYLGPISTDTIKGRASPVLTW